MDAGEVKVGGFILYVVTRGPIGAEFCIWFFRNSETQSCDELVQLGQTMKGEEGCRPGRSGAVDRERGEGQ